MPSVPVHEQSASLSRLGKDREWNAVVSAECPREVGRLAIARKRPCVPFASHSACSCVPSASRRPPNSREHERTTFHQSQYLSGFSPVFADLRRTRTYRGDQFELACWSRFRRVCNGFATAIPGPYRTSCQPMPSVCHLRHAYARPDVRRRSTLETCTSPIRCCASLRSRTGPRSPVSSRR